MRIPTAAALAGVLLGGPSLAGAGPRPQDAAETPILVRAERLIVRPGEVIENGRVLVEGGRIVGVGTDLEAPAGALELEGEVVCAGFFDPWSALGIAPEDLEFRNATPASRTADAIDFWQHEALRLQALRAGVTTVRVQAAGTGPVAGLGAVVSLDPFASPEQALLSDRAGLAMSVGLTPPAQGGQVFRQGPDGSFILEQAGREPVDPFDRLSQADRIAANIESGRQYRESQVEYRYEHAEWEKKIAEREKELEKDFKKAKKDREKEKEKAEEQSKEFKEKRYKEDTEPRRPKYDADKETLAMAAEGEIPLVVEAHRAAEIRALLDGLEGQDRVRLVLAGATECLPFADQLAERHVTVLLWPALHGVGPLDEFDGHDLALAGRLAEKGVHVLLGSGGRNPAQTRDLPLLVQYAIARGFDREEAFEALTVGAARAFDLDRELGTVEFGKRADLQILDGEPLHSATRVRYVICGGRLVVTPEG